MTLEERELVVNVLRNYHRDHAGDPEFGAWPQIAHRLAGRLAAPATQRDPAAELAEALEDVLNLDWEHYILSDRVPERRDAANEVVESAAAALAKWKERQP